MHSNVIPIILILNCWAILHVFRQILTSMAASTTMSPQTSRTDVLYSCRWVEYLMASFYLNIQTKLFLNNYLLQQLRASHNPFRCGL